MASRHPDEDEAHNQALEEASARAARAKRELEAEKLDMAKKHVSELDETSRKVNRHAKFRIPVSQGTHTALSTLRGFGRSCRCIPPWRLRAQRCGVRTAARGSISHLFHTCMHVWKLWTWEAHEQKLEKSRHLAEAWLGSHRWLD